MAPPETTSALTLGNNVEVKDAAHCLKDVLVIEKK
jgi:hypothetical protein